MKDNHKQWDTYLPQAEFTFINMPNRSIGCAPFMAAYGHQPNQVMDISNAPSGHSVEDNLVQFNKSVYEKVTQNLLEANQRYKEHG